MIDDLWRMSIYGCISILMVLAGRQILRRYPKEYSCGLWLLVLARLLLPVFIESPFSIHALLYMGKLERMECAELWHTLYPAGVLLLSGYFLVQYIRAVQRLRPAVREMKNIWRCEGISSAFVTGLIRPRIMLPYGLEGTGRWYVIRHEEMHIRHGDPWIRVLGTVALCLHWWNPLVWYAVYKMYEDMEMYCDEAVLRECAAPERKTYSRILLSLSAGQNGSAGLCFGGSHTEQRIRNILQEKKKLCVWSVLLFYLTVNLCARISFTIPVHADDSKNVVSMEMTGEDY